MGTQTVDTHVRDPAMYEPDGNPGLLARVRRVRADRFFAEYAPKIFEPGGFVLDIGGGLRIDRKRGNAFNAGNARICGDLPHRQGTRYVISDYTDKYSPDLVEDIHALSLKDGSVDGLFCLAVLEHVYDPKKAAEEISRVLRKGGRALVYMPFLYRYHAHEADYKDYYRYSKDGIAYLFRDCERILLCPVCGVFETLLKITQLHRWKPLRYLARMLDESTASLRAISRLQTSGYHIYLEK